jgi:selenoprotein W-related protein
LAALLLGELKQKIKVLELEPSGGGCFEVHVDGREVYSKLKTGEFPDSQEVLRTIAGRR